MMERCLDCGRLVAVLGDDRLAVHFPPGDPTGRWCEGSERPLKPEGKPLSGADVAAKAAALVAGDRQDAYGHPFDHFSLLAALWSPIVGVTITAERAAIMLVQLKLARELHQPSDDNVVDAAGYLLCLAEVKATRVPLSESGERVAAPEGTP